jgi:phosphoglycerate dehydrogenase-like enzyme
MIKGLYILSPDYFDSIYGPEEQAFLSDRVEFMGPPVTTGDALQLTELLGQVEVIFSGWGAPLMDQAFLDLCPSLRAVFYGAGSVRPLVTDAFWERDIVLVSAAAANATSVAEYTLSQIMFSLKHGWYWQRRVRELKRYPRHGDLSPPGNYRTRVGLISLGMIGREVARMLQRTAHHVLAYDPHVDDSVIAEFGLERAGLEEVFQQADVVSLHAPRLPETKGMITGEHFRSMRHGATFINTARGIIVREQEMIDVLEVRPDLTAVLDVVFPEPPDPKSKLFSLSNVILTPHIAGALGPECRRLGKLVCDELDRFLKGEPLRHAIHRTQLSRMA